MSKAATAGRAAGVAAGEPEPPLLLLGGLGTKPRRLKQAKPQRKGTGVNHFDLVALKAKNEAAMRAREVAK